MATEAGTGVRRRRLAAAGASTRLVEAGPAEASTAVVFVHGNPGSADDWEPLVGAIGATGTRALAFDLPDFGETIAPAGSSTRRRATRSSSTPRWRRSGSSASTWSCTTSADRSGWPGWRATPSASAA